MRAQQELGAREGEAKELRAQVAVLAKQQDDMAHRANLAVQAKERAQGEVARREEEVGGIGYAWVRVCYAGKCCALPYAKAFDLSSWIGPLTHSMKNVYAPCISPPPPTHPPFSVAQVVALQVRARELEAVLGQYKRENGRFFEVKERYKATIMGLEGRVKVGGWRG